MKRIEHLQQFEPFPIPDTLNQRFDIINQNFTELAAGGGGGGGAGGSIVTSVAGKSGEVTLTVTDVSGAAPIHSPSFTGTVQVNGKEVASKEDVQNSVVTYTEATSTQSGLMSAADKTKLDGMNAGAGTPNLTGYLRSNGSIPMEGNLNMNGFRVIGMETRFSQDAASKGYVDTEMERVKATIPSNITIALDTAAQGEQASVVKSGTNSEPVFTLKLPNLEGLVRLPKSDSSAPAINYAAAKPAFTWRNGVEHDAWGRPVDLPSAFLTGTRAYTASNAGNDPDLLDENDVFAIKTERSLKNTANLTKQYFRFSPDQDYGDYGKWYLDTYFDGYVNANGGSRTVNSPIDNSFNQYNFDNTINDGLTVAEWFCHGLYNPGNVNILLFPGPKKLDLFFKNSLTGENTPSVTMAALRVCKHALMPQTIGHAQSSDYQAGRSGVIGVMTSNGSSVGVLVVNRRNESVQFSVNASWLSHSSNDMVKRYSDNRSISAANPEWKNDATNYDIHVVSDSQFVKISQQGTLLQLSAPPRSVIAIRV